MYHYNSQLPEENDDYQPFEEELIEFDEIEKEEIAKVHSHTGRAHARRSVEEFLEHKRLRERYKELFDDSFGEKS